MIGKIEFREVSRWILVARDVRTPFMLFSWHQKKPWVGKTIINGSMFIRNILKHWMQSKLLVFSINFTPTTSQTCQTQIVHYVPGLLICLRLKAPPCPEDDGEIPKDGRQDGQKQCASTQTWTPTPQQWRLLVSVFSGILETWTCKSLHP